MSKVDEVSQMLDEIFDEKDAMEELKQQFFDAVLEDHRAMRKALKYYGNLYNVEAIIGEDGILANLNVKGGPADA